MNERISELMDGELEGKAASGAIDALGRDGDALQTWRTYHLIGDAMRDTRLLSAGFVGRVSEKLAAEPTVFAPNRIRPEPRRWVAMPAAAAASVAAVALVGWVAISPQGERPAPGPVAQKPSVQALIQPVVALQPQIVPLPSAMPDYLLAHQGFSPRLSLHGMAPYARTVSEQANEGRK
jgi:sigma-E factor negative regulatory protein RseA